MRTRSIFGIYMIDHKYPEYDTVSVINISSLSILYCCFINCLWILFICIPHIYVLILSLAWLFSIPFPRVQILNGFCWCEHILRGIITYFSITDNFELFTVPLYIGNLSPHSYWYFLPYSCNTISITTANYCYKEYAQM